MLKLIELISPAVSPDEVTRREWDRLREGALTPAERSEIDAIFSRSL